MKAVLARVVGLRRQEREVRGHGLLRVAHAAVCGPDRGEPAPYLEIQGNSH